jgi:hypothetical protein
MDWNIEAKRILRMELVRRGMSVDALASKLTQIGCVESPKSLAVKISRGKFQFSFFLQCMSALKVKTVTFPMEISEAQCPVDESKEKTVN